MELLSHIFSSIEQGAVDFSNLMWGLPLLILIFGGGLYMLIVSKFLPFRLLPKLLGTVKENIDQASEKGGTIGRFSALAATLGATVGMGNIAGVAVAVKMGGPGVMFWMWVTGIVGMGIEFFSVSLALMYRSEVKGKTEAGTMYIIMNTLGKKWKPLAILFCVAGMVAALPAFQANQLTRAIQEIILQPSGIERNFISNLSIGIIITIVVSLVIFGGIERLARVSEKLVPFMIILYFTLVFIILFLQWNTLAHHFPLIFMDAFSAEFYTGEKILGSTLGGLMILGSRRAIFASEAGVGSSSMLHGVAQVKNPIQQGVLSMLGPFTSAIIVCTLTGLSVLCTDHWKTGTVTGIALPLLSFQESFLGWGGYLLFICVSIFSLTTLFSQSYIGANCFGFLFGTERKDLYKYFYVSFIVIGCTSSLSFIISVIDAAYSLMVIPTMFITLVLFKRVLNTIKPSFS